MIAIGTGLIRQLGLLLAIAMISLAAISSSSAVCLATGKSCGLNAPSNDRLCCPGMMCGYGNVCQPGCRINGTFYPSQARRPGNVCQACQPRISTSSWTPVPTGGACGSSSSTVCDRPDTCDATGNCQPNYKPATTTCRPVAGLCDTAENCTGSSATCPSDGFLSGNECRAIAGDCDQAEACSGSSADCPADGHLSGNECRGVAGDCDQAEACSGSSADCPADGYLSGNECRGVAGDCDQAESCSGSSADCPTDGYLTGDECRGVDGDCDIAENCSGSSADCPADEIQPIGASCPDDDSDCTSQACDGIGVDCVYTPIPCSFCSVPATVVVFDNGTFVNTNPANAPHAESDNVQASLDFLGHTVTTFTAIDAASITAALNGKQVLLIPEQRLSPQPELGNVLSSAAKTVLRDYVKNGGGLIIHATRQNLDQWFLFNVFGISLAGAGEYTGNWRIAADGAVGTTFCGAQPVLFANHYTQVVNTPQLIAAGGRAIYVDPAPYNPDHSIVSIIPYFAGKIIILGWDWDDAKPTGSQDGGWLNILDRAVNEVAN